MSSVLVAPWKGLEAFLGSRRAAAGLTIIVVLIMVGLLAPVIAPHSPETIETDRILGAPNLSHPFGSDALGRDVLSRVLYAYRTSMSVAIGSVLLALLVGVPLGLLAGYFRSWTDTVLMRPLDMLLALPALLLAIALISITGPGDLVVLVAIGLIYLPIVARMMRSSVFTVSTELYIEGARARGVSHTGIMGRHALPNSLGPVIVQASILMGFAIQIEAAARLSRPRSAAAHAVAGPHAAGRLPGDARGLVGRRLSRPRDRGRRGRLHAARRRVARPSRPRGVTGERAQGQGPLGGLPQARPRGSRPCATSRWKSATARSSGWPARAAAASRRSPSH